MYYMNIKSITLFLLGFITFSISANPTLHTPYNGQNINSDFYFICQSNDDETLTLEISDKESFDNIIFRNSTRWLTKDGGWKQMPVSPSELGNGIFFWRVAFNDTYSETRYFTITGQHESNSNYTIVHDQNEYSLITLDEYNAPLCLSSLWIRSNNTSNGLEQPDNGGSFHGMVVKNDIIYICYGGLNIENPMLYRYDANTGETLEPISINYGAWDKGYNMLSDIGIDDLGNIYSINCVSSDEENKDKFLVDMLEIEANTSTAFVSKRYECLLPSAAKKTQQYIMFGSAKGNLASGEFSFFSIAYGESNRNILCRWDFSNNQFINDSPTTTIVSAASSSTNNRILPIETNYNYCIIDNEKIHPTIRNFDKASYISEFSSNTSFTPSDDKYGNGVYIFNHGNAKMMLYARTHSKTNGTNFELLNLPSNFFDGSDSESTTFNNIRSLWQFPQNNLGKRGTNMGVTSTLAASTSEITYNGYPSTKIYIYGAGTGLAAYKLSHYTTTSIEALEIEPKITYTIKNNLLIISNESETISIYNLTGTLIAHATFSNKIDISHLSHGIYILKIGSTIQKIVI